MRTDKLTSWGCYLVPKPNLLVLFTMKCVAVSGENYLLHLGSKWVKTFILTFRALNQYWATFNLRIELLGSKPESSWISRYFLRKMKRNYIKSKSHHHD